MATLIEIENLLNIEVADRRLRPGKMQAGINYYYYYENMYYVVELPQGICMICADNITTRQVLKTHCWRLSTDGYAQTSFNNKTKYFHQLYLTNEANLVCDHANRKRFDNRHDNLRIVTRRQNMRNLTKKKTNTSEQNESSGRGTKDYFSLPADQDFQLDEAANMTYYTAKWGRLLFLCVYCTIVFFS